MSHFKAKMHQIVSQLGLCPIPHLYSVYFTYLYILLLALARYYKIVSRPMDISDDLHLQ